MRANRANPNPDAEANLRVRPTRGCDGARQCHSHTPRYQPGACHRWMAGGMYGPYIAPPRPCGHAAACPYERSCSPSVCVRVSMTGQHQNVGRVIRSGVGARSGVPARDSGDTMDTTVPDVWEWCPRNLGGGIARGICRGGIYAARSTDVNPVNACQQGQSQSGCRSEPPRPPDTGV
jgi:hypothetical protein